MEHRTDQAPDQPTPTQQPRPADTLTTVFANFIRLECGDRVNRWNLLRAIRRTCDQIHGVTSYAEAARDADAHRLLTLTGRVPFDGLSGYRYAERLAVSA